MPSIESVLELHGNGMNADDFGGPPLRMVKLPRQPGSVTIDDDDLLDWPQKGILRIHGIIGQLLGQTRRRAEADDRSLSSWIRRAAERELGNSA